MATIAVEASNIRPLAGALIRRYPAASTNVAVGKAVYVKSDGTIELSDGDAVGTSQARGIVVGIGVGGKTTAAVNDACDVVTHGPVFLGDALDMTEGGVIYVAPTASSVDGILDQTASATSGKYNYILGYAESPKIMYVQGQMTIPTAVP